MSNSSRKSEVFNKTWTFEPEEEDLDANKTNNNDNNINAEPATTTIITTKEKEEPPSSSSSSSNNSSPLSYATASSSDSTNRNAANMTVSMSSNTTSPSPSSSGAVSPASNKEELNGNKRDSTGSIDKSIYSVSNRIFIEPLQKSYLENVRLEIDNYFMRNFAAADELPNLDEESEDLLIALSNHNSPLVERKVLKNLNSNDVNNRTIDLEKSAVIVGESTTTTTTTTTSAADELEQYFLKRSHKDLDNFESNLRRSTSNRNQMRLSSNINKTIDLDDNPEEDTDEDLLKSCKMKQIEQPDQLASSVPKTFDLFLNDLKNSSISMSRPISPTLANSNDRINVASGLSRASVNMKVMTSSIDHDLNKATVNNNFIQSNNLSDKLRRQLSQTAKTSSPYKTSLSSINNSNGALNRSYTLEKPSNANADIPNIEAIEPIQNMDPVQMKKPNPSATIIRTKPGLQKQSSSIASTTTTATSQTSNLNYKANLNRTNSKKFNSNESLSDYGDDTSSRSSDNNRDNSNDIVLDPNSRMLVMKNHVINKTFDEGTDNTEAEAMDVSYEPVVFNTTYTPWNKFDEAELAVNQQQQATRINNTSSNRTMVLNRTQDLNNNSYRENELNKTRDIIDDDLESVNDNEPISEMKPVRSLPKTSNSAGNSRRSELIRPTINPSTVTNSRLSLMSTVRPLSKLSIQVNTLNHGSSASTNQVKSPTLGATTTTGAEKSKLAKLASPTAVKHPSSSSTSSLNTEANERKSMIPKNRFGFNPSTHQQPVPLSSTSSVSSIKSPKSPTSPTHTSSASSKQTRTSLLRPISSSTASSSVGSTTTVTTATAAASKAKPQETVSVVSSKLPAPGTLLKQPTAIKSKLAAPTTIKSTVVSNVPSAPKLAATQPSALKAPIDTKIKPPSNIPSFKSSSSIQNLKYQATVAVKK